ncbi:sarcosine oxidase subunit gamma [Roseospira goensis]|uniref:Heterotetrameric sarcosine oxidase gamma subunit n=1 Tax=Roseospira goensis TaxID=391922 RepID=A0A7W6S1F9_9PROT|nr:hypothetical protein [Roseospira goensis]MBB4287135.1 heterotetrameric sarcosine oxidase gamma subunit [Roseospira goensis]
MPETADPAAVFDRPAPCSPLAEHWGPGRHGASDGPPGVTATERRDRALWHVDAGRAAAPATLAGLTLPRMPNTGTAPEGPDGPAALWLGPGRWLLVLPPRAPRPAAAGLSVVDLSHGRCVLRLVGPAVRTVLAGGCLLDLSVDGLPAGRCAQTLLFAVPVLLHAGTAETVDIHVPRSYAVALWETLSTEALVHGLEVCP